MRWLVAAALIACCVSCGGGAGPDVSSATALLSKMIAAHVACSGYERLDDDEPLVPPSGYPTLPTTTTVVGYPAPAEVGSCTLESGVEPVLVIFRNAHDRADAMRLARSSPECSRDDYLVERSNWVINTTDAGTSRDLAKALGGHFSAVECAE